MVGVLPLISWPGRSMYWSFTCISSHAPWQGETYAFGVINNRQACELVDTLGSSLWVWAPYCTVNGPFFLFPSRVQFYPTRGMTIASCYHFENCYMILPVNSIKKLWKVTNSINKLWIWLTVEGLLTLVVGSSCFPSSFSSPSYPLPPQDGTSSELPDCSSPPCTSPLPLWPPGVDGGVSPEPDGPLHPWHSKQGDRKRPPLCTVCLFPKHLLPSPWQR